MPTRRDLLKTTAVGAASCILSKFLFAKQPGSNFHFIHTDTLNLWSVANPVQWSLQNAHQPILARAADGLGKLSVNDADRIIRLVLRRCSLNLLELQPGSVLVHHWGSNQADLKPFFKANGLACPEVQVVLKDRKKETGGCPMCS